MTPENFAYWLNGYFEIAGKDSTLTLEQIQVIKDHLALVLKKVTLNYNITSPGTITVPYPSHPWSPGIVSPGDLGPLIC